MSQPIRVVVVDDSRLMQRMITDLLQQDPAVIVVGTASNGRDAIELIERLRPDVVTMDVRMPVMDGLATTEHLMAYCPTPILVLTASLARHDIDITFKMLGAGALDVVEKPSGHDPRALARAGHDIVRRIKLLARVKVVTHLRGRRRSADVPPPPQPARPSSAPVAQPAAHVARPSSADADFAVIVLGASTGGPRVVQQILSDLPAGFRAAVFVVQHIAEGFSDGMAEWLAASCRLPVQVAREGLPIQPGMVLVAPSGSDLLLTRDRRIHLSHNSLLLQRPSVDVAMQAIADLFGSRVIGVLLTGMGRDGAYGMLTIRKAGGHTIAQDEASSAIFGMPRAAIALGSAAEVLPASRIASRLIELVSSQYAVIRSV